MKTQEIYNNVLETRDFQHVSQYARRQRNSDLSRPQIAIHSQLRHHCRGCFSRCKYVGVHFRTSNQAISILVSIFVRNQRLKRKIFFRFQTFFHAAVPANH